MSGVNLPAGTDMLPLCSPITTSLRQSQRSHATSHTVRDADTLWVGSLGSLARISAVVFAQTPAMQERIREMFHR
jgi:hypothetical protein